MNSLEIDPLAPGLYPVGLVDAYEIVNVQQRQ
jgi:hypothetical protein